MTSTVGDWLRGCTAIVLAVVLVVGCLEVPLAHAADPANSTTSNTPSGSPQGTEPAADPGQAAPDAPPPAVVAPTPQLQLQDEGPSARISDSVAATSARATADRGDEQPFWKSWIFWTITGALVIGAVSLAAYTSSGVNSSLAPCPPDIQVSLGCYGAGRAR